MKNKKGFTLAEVLITLGIIGVVAALSIPTLINNYQKTQYVTQLKKTYVTVQEFIKQEMAKTNAENIADTDLIDTDTNTAKIDEAIKKSIKTVKTCIDWDPACIPKTCKDGEVGCTNGEYKQLDFANWGYYNWDVFSRCNRFYTLDGALVRLCFSPTCVPNNSLPSKMKANCGSVFIDVNGQKEPNQYGRDLFEFDIAHDGTLYPNGSKESELYSGNPNAYWAVDQYQCGAIGSKDIEWSSGMFCAARIVEEGWQMNY